MRKSGSKLGEAVQRCADTLRRGRVLAIDPASGSQGSMPGYVICEGSALVESGYLGLPLGQVETRLHGLARVLREDDSFRDVDVLVIERIPPFMSSRGGDFRTQGVINLHMSIGVVLGEFGHLPTVWVPPASWKATCKREDWPLKITSGDSKDEFDALVMMYTVLSMAGVEGLGALRERIAKVAMLGELS